jgi:hypothetical protein
LKMITEDAWSKNDNMDNVKVSESII